MKTPDIMKKTERKNTPKNVIGLKVDWVNNEK